MYVTRFAPTPSGPLHFGSLVTLTGAYLRCRSQSGRFLLRIEDLDTPRCPPGMGDEIISEIEKLGFDHDGPVLVQSRNVPRYRAALDCLTSRGRTFRCVCTRQSLKVSPCRCRDNPLIQATSARASIRFVPPSDRIGAFDDELLGRISVSADGDPCPALRRADGIFAYNLACVVDDLDSGVTEVVRGRDLLYATCVQNELYEALGAPCPRYLHLPLALADGTRKLSKQNHARAVLEEFTPAQALIRALSFLGQDVTGLDAISDCRRILAVAVTRFDMRKIPAQDRIFTPESSLTGDAPL